MTANQVDGPPAAPVRRTVEELVRERLRTAAVRTVAPRADRDRPVPLSAGQQQMWVLHRLDPGSPAYLLSWVLRIEGPLDAEALRLAWRDLAERHEILRTRYAGAGGEEAVQTVDPGPAPGWRVVDLAHVPAGRREERARQVAEWVRRRPFDLAAEQPLRVTLLRLGPRLHLMVVTVHHIACDGPAQLGRELGPLYAARVSGQPAGLPRPAVQYGDFAVWERAGLAEGRLEPHLAHWRAVLDGVAELPLPLDRPRPARPDGRGGAVVVEVSAQTSEAVRALAAAHRTSPFAVLLTAFHAALGRIAGVDDVTVGLPATLRTAPELADVVGYLVNTVVVRARPRAGVSFGELLDEVRGGLLGALDHQAAPFAWVVDDLTPVRAAGVNPLFQAAFDMDVPAGEELFRLPGLAVEQLGLAEAPTAKFDLNLHADVLPDGRFAARLEYAAAVVDETTAAAWAACWRSVLEAGVHDPDTPLSAPDAPLSSPDASLSSPDASLSSPDAPLPPSDFRTREAGAAPVAPLPEAQPAAEPGTQPGAEPEVRPDRPSGTASERVAELVTAAWCEALGVSGPDPEDNFFDVGGDSLRAVALAGQLRGEGLDVAAADLFEHQSIAELTAALAERAAVVGLPDPVAPFSLLSPEDAAALPTGLADAYPLAAVQLGMLVEQRSQAQLNTYQDSTSYFVRDDAPLDPDLLWRAVQTVVDRHEVLRTSFDLSGFSVPLQLVHRAAPIEVGTTFVPDGEPEDWLPLLKEFGAAERRTPMDLSRPPLIRVHAHARRDRARWWLTITECHPILEGWSFHTMLMEFLTVYRALRDGGLAPPPEPVPFRYADYIAAEARARASEEDREHWRRTVTERAEPPLPVAWQDPPEAERLRHQYLVDLRDLDSELRRLAEQTRTSPKAVLLALHLTVMRLAAGGAEDFFTGLVCDARPEAAGADRVLGMYLNTLPFRHPLGARTWGDLVRRVHDGLTALWPHRAYPMPSVQQEFGGGDRLLDVFFNYLDFHQVDDDLVDGDRTYNDNVNEFGLHVFTVPGLLRVNADNHTVGPDAAPVLLGLYRLVAEEMALGPDGPVELVRARLAEDQPAPGRPVRRPLRQAVDEPVAAVLPRLVEAVEDTATAAAAEAAENAAAEAAEAAENAAAEAAEAAGDSRIAAGVTARVLGRDRLPVPRGVPGELWLAGTACTDPGCPHPYDPCGFEGGPVLHRTGTAARVGLDGALELLGAADLDPEAALLWPDGSADALLRAGELIERHQQPAESLLLIRRVSEDKGSLTAYLRTPDGGAADVASVRRWLADRRLPRRHTPEAWVEVPEWPLRADGTLAVERLPEPAAPQARESAAAETPWDDVFEKLLRKALGPTTEGAPQRPADLVLADAGLDSFGMVGLLVAIEHAYDITVPDDIPMVDVFRTPRTLWETVARLREEQEGC
ncbi:condensation domain-containing protein [Streptomyces sp. NPDC020996]|uniref:condensation domain-containing protein n=1 Tax=Streptomyces sp. NPDC020996 TaxID=3154791 RepID=UPI0033F9A801